MRYRNTTDARNCKHQPHCPRTPRSSPRAGATSSRRAATSTSEQVGRAPPCAPPNNQHRATTTAQNGQTRPPPQPNPLGENHLPPQLRQWRKGACQNNDASGEKPPATRAALLDEKVCHQNRTSWERPTATTITEWRRTCLHAHQNGVEGAPIQPQGRRSLDTWEEPRFNKTPAIQAGGRKPSFSFNATAI